MSDQIQNVEQAATAVASTEPALTADDPLVPFQSAMRLTGAQEKKMLDHAFKRLDQLSSDLARDVVMNPTWWNNSSVPAPAVSALQAGAQGLLPQDTFLGKRTRYEASYMNDVSWRPFTMGVANIFMQSNLTVPLSRRIARQMVAKAKNHFFGSDPWLAVNSAPHPSMPVDEMFAERVDAFVQFKLKEAGSKSDKERAIERALILGECPVKTSYVVRDQIFDIEAEVLINIDGEPITAADGNFITKSDEFVDGEPQPMAPEGFDAGVIPEGEQPGVPQAPQPMMPPQKVLKRDGVTPAPDAPLWSKKLINRRQVFFEGARSEPIYYKDFLCPINAKDVQTADCVIHLYDKQVMVFVDLLVKRGMVAGDADTRKKTAAKIADLVKALSSNSNQAKAAETQTLRPNETFTNTNQGTDQPVAEFAEFYLWYDANEDGIAENIMLIADRKTQRPIFYDHVANVTTDGLRPIEIIRVNPVEGRWYGVGIMELFESYQVITDLLVNRWNFSQSRAGRVDFWNPTGTQEGDRDPHLKMNWGGTYTKKPGVKMDDILETKYLTDVKFEQIQTMMQFFMQLAMNESGVTNANDNYVAGMEQSKLATGINQIEKSGDEMFKPLVAQLKEPLERLLKREVEVLLANMNPEEVFEVLEGNTMGLDQITAEQVKGIRYRISLLLTTEKNQHTIQVTSAASQLIERFYTLPPLIQDKVAPFYRKQLRALDPEIDAESVITVGLMLPPEGGPGGPPGAGGGEPGKNGGSGDGPESALGVTPPPPPSPLMGQ
jgi:hypothetical protein